MIGTVPVTPEVVDRVLEIETENTISRLRPIQDLPGNPYRVQMRRFGRAVAFSCDLSLELYNSVLDVTAESIDDLDDFADFYRTHGGAGLIEIAPGRFTADLGRALHARGYAMTDFHAGLVRAVRPEDAELPLVEGVDVQRIDPEDAEVFAQWVDVFTEAWTTDETPREALMTWAANRELWRFYLARVDGAPAGAAVLDVRGRTALDASAATRPAFRGRRAQSALIRARIVDAARLGCDLLVGGAYFGTSSMRNHQRQGYATAFTRGIWTPPASAS